MLNTKCIILFKLLSFIALSITKGQFNLQKWQCSSRKFRPIISIVSEDPVAFHIIENHSWLYRNRPFVNCFQKGLSKVPQGLDSDIEILNLDRNTIYKISRNDFGSYPKLVAITMVNNCIKVDFYNDKIPRCQGYFTAEVDAFSSLKHLKYLALNGNVMKTLPQFPKSLSVLFLSFSSLRPLTKINFEKLTKLKIAVFSANCITGDLKHYCQGNFTIKTNVFSSTSVLQFLDLSYDNLEQIPTYLFNRSLLGIKLRGNPFHTVHSRSFINATKLKYLNLGWTSQYDQIPLHIEKNVFYMLTDLETLDLSGNMIFQLPSQFLSNNKKLKALNLAFNCLKHIATNPEVLPHLPLLEELHVSGNTFCKSNVISEKPLEKNLTFSIAYHRFPNLTTLVLGTSVDIQGSQFTMDFPHYYLWYGWEYVQIDQESLIVLRNLTRFKQLSLSFCGIRYIHQNAFKGLNLNFLDIRFNIITSFSGQIVLSDKSEEIRKISNFYATQNKQLNKLVDPADQSIVPVVYLSHNRVRLTNMASFDLNHLANTSLLDLSYNQIEYVNNKTFRNFLQLQILDLRFNPIRRIASGSFSMLPHLLKLKLNLTSFLSNIDLEFLKTVKTNFTFSYGDTSSKIYYFLVPFKNSERPITFFNVTFLDVSYIAIPTFLISNNLEIFSSFPNLYRLIMNGAQLTFDLQSNFFNGLNHLQILTMKECWIENFPDAALSKLHNLVYLDLSFNKIQVLDVRLLSNYSNLKSLILSYNFIHKITPGTLSFLVQNGLENISLNHNRIRQLDTSIIDKKILKSLLHLDLRGNPIMCDCTISNSFGWLIRSKSLKNISIPGFFPECSDVLFDYYGGCLICEAPNSVKPPSLFVYSLSNNCNEEFLVVLMSSFATLISLFTTLSFIFTSKRFKQKLFALLSRDVHMKPENIFPQTKNVFVYDGFVYFDKANTEVADWIDNVMMPRLETESQSFRMCVVGRDDWCVTSPVKQLHFRIQASRKTIIVLSKGFSQTPQCRYVVSVLEEWNYRKENKSIIVMYKERFSGGLLQFHCRRNRYSVLLYMPEITDDEIFHVSLKNDLMQICM